MKNKKALYILLPVVIVVWGIIAFKIFGHLDKKEPVPLILENTQTVQENNIVPDTFNLIYDYKDPFLNKKSPAKKNVSKRVKKVKTENERIVWPDILYTGRMVNQSTNKSLVSLTINGKEWIFNIGDQKDNITLLKTYDDSVKVKYEQETKYIHKQQ